MHLHFLSSPCICAGRENVFSLPLEKQWPAVKTNSWAKLLYFHPPERGTVGFHSGYKRSICFSLLFAKAPPGGARNPL